MTPLSKPLRNNRGSAIMFSMFMLSLLVFIAMEVAKDSVVEYQVSLNAVRRVQAYYAAKACTDLSLLRIKAYQQAVSALGSSLPDPTMLEMIWQFPLAWPIMAPADLNDIDKGHIKEAMTKSTFKHQFSAKISGESSKIDINDLASQSQVIRERTKQQILDIFQSKIMTDQSSEFSKKYYSFRFENLVNNMADWIDVDRESLNGGDEGSYYPNMRSNYMPPNQPFKTIEELHMVKDMTDDIYNVLAPMITIYGVKGVNINYADKDLLMSLDRRITADVADQIIQRRDDPALGGRFKDIKDFTDFMSGYGVDVQAIQQESVPLYFDQEVNFNISCIGVVGRITSEITTTVFDFQRVSSRLQANMTPPGPCDNEQGDNKYECLCKDVTDAAAKQKCKDDKKAADTKTQNQSPVPAPLPGPPYVIFQDVK